MSSIEEVTGNVAERALNNLVTSLGSWAGDLVGRDFVGWRLDNLTKTSEKFNNACAKRGISEQQKRVYAKKFGYEWMLEASKEDNDSIQSMWANLLVNACDKDKENPSLIFIDTLKKINSNDRILLEKVAGQHFHFEKEHKDAFIISNDEELTKVMSSQDILISLATLETLGLVTRNAFGPDCFSESIFQQAFLSAVNDT